jgi:hypothetical protein
LLLKDGLLVTILTSMRLRISIVIQLLECYNENGAGPVISLKNLALFLYTILDGCRLLSFIGQAVAGVCCVGEQRCCQGEEFGDGAAQYTTP